VPFRPTILFVRADVPPGVTAAQAAAAVVPGASGRGMTLNMMRRVIGKGALTDEPFSAFHARMPAGDSPSDRAVRRPGHT